MEELQEIHTVYSLYHYQKRIRIEHSQRVERCLVVGKVFECLVLKLRKCVLPVLLGSLTTQEIVPARRNIFKNYFLLISFPLSLWNTSSLHL